MRVLVSTTAGSGHLGPLLPFARACAAAGHEVVVAAPGSFAAQVDAAGFPHRPFADVPPERLGAVFGQLSSLTYDQANEVVVADVFGRLDAQAAWPGLKEIVDDWRPDVVLRDPAEFGSVAAARSAGIPQAAVAIGVGETLDYFASLVRAPLAELDALAGLPPGACAAAMLAAPTLTCVPPLLDGPEAGPPGASGPVHRFRDDSLVAERAALPGAWGDPSQPLVYLSFGSVAASQPDFAALFPVVLAAFADRPVRVLMTTGHGVDPAGLGPVPPNIRVEGWWPQRDVMPEAAAVVGHGGFGTTMAAVAAGVPQVVVPLFSIDQRVNAERIAATGAGVHLEGGPAAMPALAEAVERVLADASYREGARTLAAEMAQLPPVADAVTVVEGLLTG